VSTISKMPLGAVIDDQIACLHSGIPKTSGYRLNVLYNLPATIRNMEENPIGYDVFFALVLRTSTNISIYFA